MDTAELQKKIEGVWVRLPSIFTVYDVCELTGLSRYNTAARVALGTALDSMVERGCLYRSLVIDGTSGRKPSAWAKDRSGLPEEVVLRAVREVLPRMPRYFTVQALMEELSTTRLKYQVRGALKRLEDEGVVMAVTVRTHSGPGRPPRLWSSNTDVIAAEKSFRATAAQQQQADRFRGWDPFDH